MTITKPKVLALDLEGTLISTIMTKIPRPGLLEFLHSCQALFPRIVMYTAVPEHIFRPIAKQLVESGNAPAWFADIEYTHGNRFIKDLRHVRGAEVDEIILVDDFEPAIHPEQKSQWLPIKCFDPPFEVDENGLAKTLSVLTNLMATRND